MLLPLELEPATDLLAGGRLGATEAARRAAELARPAAAVGEGWTLRDLAQTPEIRGALEAVGPQNPDGGGDLSRPVWPALVTLGPAVEEEVARLMRDGRLHEAYCLDEAGTALLGRAAQELCRRLGGVWLAPGCHGLPLSLVPLVWRLSGAGEAGVEVRPSGMLEPVKSVAGLVLPGAGRLSACAACLSQVCPWAGQEGK